MPHYFICKFCNKEFYNRNIGSKYCSKTCANRRRKIDYKNSENNTWEKLYKDWNAYIQTYGYITYGKFIDKTKRSP